MNFAGHNSWVDGQVESAIDDRCMMLRAGFDDYLDGATSGVEMAAIAEHLDACVECAAEFQALRDVQSALAELGPAKPPTRLQARLRTALATEFARGTHLPPTKRWMAAWKTSIAPMALRLTGGFAAMIVLLGGAGWFLGLPGAVQANDDRMAHLVSPHYLYSYVPPQPIETRHDAAILVEAQVDTAGRVYDYQILEGPKDVNVQRQVEQNLLSSIFQPATAFGVPVRGHVVLTFTGVSVRG